MGYSKTKKIRLSKYDKLWSQIVRERDGKCLYCGKTEFLAAHHFKGRACKATRLMLDNGISLCPAHHTFNYEFSAHRTPEAFTRWFKKEYPSRYRKIIKKAQTMMSERDAINEFIAMYETRNS
jgi:hypothetical protein